jgi:hypothetical protein
VVSTATPYRDDDDGIKDEAYEHNRSRFPHCARKHMALNFWWRAENWVEAENYEKAATEKLFEQIFSVLEST